MPLSFSEYQALALRTYKGPSAPVHMLTNGALGLTGEAGEVADLVKKFMYPSKPGDGLDAYERITAELGDVLWYVALVAQAVGVPLESIAAANIAKLAKRHNVPEPTSN
jgi:NTP pyrophosphatase (non-canonical NTP hydrolase)